MLFRPGNLWQAVTQRTERALRSGALQPIPTEHRIVVDSGVRFVVRKLAQLKRKKQARKIQDETAKATGKAPNPFLPYDEEMWKAVAEVLAYVYQLNDRRTVGV